MLEYHFHLGLVLENRESLHFPFVLGFAHRSSRKACVER